MSLADPPVAGRASYRPCPVKRPRRTKATIDGIKQSILDVIRADPPMTVRQVFYQLVARGVIEKTEEAYKNAVNGQRTTDTRTGKRKREKRKPPIARGVEGHPILKQRARPGSQVWYSREHIW